MDLKTWTPFPYIEGDWHIDLPRFFREPSAFRPSIDVVKEEGQIVLTAELAGMTAEDVEVSLDEDILIVKGEKSEESETEEADRVIRERTYGSFQRQIAVPAGVTADGIEAAFENGVLTVRVKLPEEKVTEPKRIPVGSKNGS